MCVSALCKVMDSRAFLHYLTLNTGLVTFAALNIQTKLVAVTYRQMEGVYVSVRKKVETISSNLVEKEQLSWKSS